MAITRDARPCTPQHEYESMGLRTNTRTRHTDEHPQQMVCVRGIEWIAEATLRYSDIDAALEQKDPPYVHPPSVASKHSPNVVVLGAVGHTELTPHCARPLCSRKNQIRLDLCSKPLHRS